MDQHSVSRLEGEKATQRQLNQQRDLAWTTYETLNNKVVELNLARNAANSKVRLGVPAIPPVRPAPSALCLPICLPFFATYMGQEPFFLRRRQAKG